LIGAVPKAMIIRSKSKICFLRLSSWLPSAATHARTSSGTRLSFGSATTHNSSSTPLRPTPFRSNTSGSKKSRLARFTGVADSSHVMAMPLSSVAKLLTSSPVPATKVAGLFLEIALRFEPALAEPQQGAHVRCRSPRPIPKSFPRSAAVADRGAHGRDTSAALVDSTA
jgi:hypothetical protein